MKYNLTEISELIKDRRTIYPEQFSSRKIHKEQIELLLNNAIWAPTHGNTQPWKFTVFTENSKSDLSDFLAKMYLENVTDWKKANLTRFIGIALAATLIRYFQLVIIRNRKRGNDIPEILRYVAKYISISSRNKFIFFFEIFFAFFYLSLRKVLTSSINLGILIYLRLRKK
jgi:nitroreductase